MPETPQADIRDSYKTNQILNRDKPHSVMKTIFTSMAFAIAGILSGFSAPTGLPAHFAPTQEDYDASVILPDIEEPNWDFGNYWIRAEGESLDVFRCFYDYNAPQDDWLILPALDTQDGGKLRVSYAAYSTAKVTYSLVWGNEPTPEGMTNVIMTAEDFESTFAKTEVDEEFSVPYGGEIYVGFHVTTPRGGGYLDIRDITVSKATTAYPAAPEIAIEMDGIEGVATITLPTLTVGGDPIPADKVSAVLLVDGVEALTVTGEPGKVINDGFSTTFGEHTAECYATYTSDGAEWKSQSVTRQFAASLPDDFILDLPLEYTPSGENDDWLTILDVNDDGVKWGYTDENGGELKLAYNSKLAADDWAILPPVNVTKGGKYKLTMRACAQSANCPESVELCLGKAASPDAMTFTAIRIESLTAVRNGDGSMPLFEGVIELPSEGRYFIGLHGFSAPDQLYLHVSTITMEKAQADYEFIDPEVYATLPDNQFDLSVIGANADGVKFTVAPSDMMMLYTNILVDESYLTEDGLGELDFADQIINVSNKMLKEVGSLSAAMSAEFFYIGNQELLSFGGMTPGTRAFLALMGVEYHEDTNSVTPLTKVTTSDVFEFTAEHFPVEEPWADFGDLEYLDVNGQNTVRVEILPNSAAGDYAYGKVYPADYRDSHSDVEIIDYLTATANMMETWIYPSRLDAALQPGEQALFTVTTLDKSSGKKSDKLNWMIVEAPAQLGQPVKVIASATGEAGIRQIGTGSTTDTSAMYFTIDGRSVNDDDLRPGLYIRISGGKATKVIVE